MEVGWGWGRLFLTIATLFDAEPGRPVADGRPQPENLPDAVSVNIHPLAFNRQWVPGLFLGGKPPVVLPRLPLAGLQGLLGDFHG